jgi:anti-sigma regulatory factor (Ser/Thr protein kinase)
MKRSWTINKDSSQLAILRDHLQTFFDKTEIDDTKKTRMVLCVDEAAANIIEHVTVTSKNEEVKDFLVEIELSGSYLKVFITDEGKPYDPTNNKDVDLKEHIGSGNRNGLGVFIMRSHLDLFEYKYENYLNVLTLGMQL